MTRVVHGYPPNIDDIVARFPGVRNGTIVFAWGDVIYAPAKGVTLAHHLIVHEETHFRQQAEAGGPGAWWERYLADDAFRLAQEVEAYRAQIAAVPDRAERRRVTATVVRHLAGPMYGRIVTKEQARALLSTR